MQIYLKAWREYRSLSSRQLSAIAKVSTATITDIEKNGSISTPKVRQRLATALDIPTELLFTEPDTKKLTAALMSRLELTNLATI